MRENVLSGVKRFLMVAMVLPGVLTAGTGVAQEATARSTAIAVCRAATANGDDDVCLAGCAVSELALSRASDKVLANGLYAYEVSGTLMCPPVVAGRPELINRRLMAQMAQRCKTAREVAGSTEGFRMLPTKILPGKLQGDGRRVVALEGDFQCGAASGVVEQGWLSRLMNRLF